MKKQNFPDFALEALADKDLTDEQLCSMYVKKYYGI
jgi:hypothetical protein